MKKILTLLFCTALISSAFAQRNNHDDWKRNNNRNVYQNTRYPVAQRDQQIQRVSREYDYKIQQVNYNRYMSRREKKRAIRSLQAEKAQRINRIYAESNSRYVYNNNRRGDNGNHYGRDNDKHNNGREDDRYKDNNHYGR